MKASNTLNITYQRCPITIERCSGGYIAAIRGKELCPEPTASSPFPEPTMYGSIGAAIDAAYKQIDSALEMVA